MILNSVSLTDTHTYKQVYRIYSWLLDHLMAKELARRI